MPCAFDVYLEQRVGNEPRPACTAFRAMFAPCRPLLYGRLPACFHAMCHKGELLLHVYMVLACSSRRTPLPCSLLHKGTCNVLL